MASLIAVDKSRCVACGECFEFCPQSHFESYDLQPVLKLGEDNMPEVVEPDNCIGCMTCADNCMACAVMVVVAGVEYKPAIDAAGKEKSEKTL